MEPLVQMFLASPRFAVVGASTNRTKFGNKVLRCYSNNGKEVTPVNPREDTIEGLKCVASLSSLTNLHGTAVSVVTPPAITLGVIEEVSRLGLTTPVWLQPGSENPEVIERANELGVALIHGGPCVLVQFGCSDDM
ncbi:unnamed protein product [Choristocarpus tenellus]